MIRRLAIGLGVLLGLVVLVAAGVVLSDLTYWRRIATIKDASAINVDWYSPLQTVKGGAGTPLPVAAAGEGTIDPAALKAATDYVDARGSVSLLVWHAGKLQLEHYGQGYGPDTRTDPASMHKSVMSLLYGTALRDGILSSVDEPAAKYITEWAGDERAKITIRDLMQMASGLKPPPFDRSPFAPGTKLYLGTDIWHEVEVTPAEKPPQTEFQYANANSQALGMILERAAKRPYADLLSEKLWAPLGAKDARLWLDREGGHPRTYCCIQATARDWMRVGLLILNKGQVDGREVVPAGWIAQMATPSKMNPLYGYQVWLAGPYTPARGYGPATALKIKASEPYLEDDMIFFDGAGSQRVYVLPKAGVVIVRTGASTYDWDDSLLPNTILRGIKPAAN